MGKSICKLYSHVYFIYLFNFISCGSSTGGSSSDTGTALVMDQVSAVPLINGQSQTFYIYAANNGTSTMSNIEWIIDGQEVVSNPNMVQRAKCRGDISMDRI